MDRMLACEAGDPGSIPGESTIFNEGKNSPGIEPGKGSGNGSFPWRKDWENPWVSQL